MRALSNTFQLLFEYVTNIVFNDDGSVTGAGALENDIDAEVGYNFGFYSRPNDGTAGIVFKPGGKGGSAVLICFRKKQYEISLNKGEVALANESGATVLLDKDGNVNIQNGSSGIARKDDAVKVTIPAGAVIVAVASGVGTSNHAPIECTGTITAASVKAKCG